MKELNKIIDEVESLKTLDFHPSDDAILISATQIFLKKESKPVDFKRQQNPAKIKIKDPLLPATVPQKEKLHKMGIEYPEDVNMGEASKLIEQNPNSTTQNDY